MKLVKEILYEKFTEDSDPIADMGIGKIIFDDTYKEIFKTPNEKWNKFAKSLLGKTVEGHIDFSQGGTFTPDATIRYFGDIEATAIKKIKIKSIKAWPGHSNVFVIDEDGVEYILYGNREYLIY